MAATSDTESRRRALPYRVINSLLRSILRVLPPSLLSENVALWWGYRYRPVPCVVKLRSGASIKFAHTDYLQLLLYYLGTFEPHCLCYLYRCAGKGSTIVDVGANIGFYTIESSLSVGPTGRVISIEAAPSHARSIRENVRLNDFENIKVIETAVGDTTGEAVLTLPSGDNLGAYTLGRVIGEQAHNVVVRRIDDILEEQGTACVDFIKMDIEGSELRALRGAENTLKSNRPTILLELNSAALQKCGSSVGEVKEFLERHGYRGWILTRTAARSIENSDDHSCDECLFIHRENISLIKALRLHH
jgi:FkbM family methyltransferase